MLNRKKNTTNHNLEQGSAAQITDLTLNAIKDYKTNCLINAIMISKVIRI